ncbi:MAG TPA: branched-chain amino acid ABC transporter permease [Deinococcales bacterium]|nr:branched-chain amino acid ABC transporter permease [Deinococcales bacterium]
MTPTEPKLQPPTPARPAPLAPAARRSFAWGGPIAWAALGLLAVAFPFLDFGANTQQLRSMAEFAVITATLALSWDILARTGQLSLAHAAFYGLGAYTYGIMANAGIPQVLALLTGGVVAVLASLLLGAVTLRLSGMYFAIATLAFAQVVQTIVNQLPLGFAGGAMGMTVPGLFGGGVREIYLAGLVILALCVLTSTLIERGRLGIAFRATREGELVARVLGVRTTSVKLTAFAISSFFAGLAGAVFAGATFYINPLDAFSTSVSVTALVIPIFGGLYTTAGPVLAAFLLRALEDTLRLYVGQGYLVGYGLILVVSILFLPRGLAGLFRRVLAARSTRAARPSPQGQGGEA